MNWFTNVKPIRYLAGPRRSAPDRGPRLRAGVLAMGAVADGVLRGGHAGADASVGGAALQGAADHVRAGRRAGGDGPAGDEPGRCPGGGGAGAAEGAPD